MKINQQRSSTSPFGLLFICHESKNGAKQRKAKKCKPNFLSSRVCFQKEVDCNFVPQTPCNEEISLFFFLLLQYKEKRSNQNGKRKKWEKCNFRVKEFLENPRRF
ncbi:hypothetical protein CEXT_335541 [Caerostris extrusa]|uniref:Uncharacterized protein n=1 Tax=Caerostris extrusa TaxID=172846 RepID=A0AAV4UUV8_CAEEX|nr:hypothetical protein CEXT_335541 [Caerostris extrusa]